MIEMLSADGVTRNARAEAPRRLLSLLEGLCGEEDARRLAALLEECIMLRSDWIVLAEGGRGVVLRVFYAEDEVYVSRAFELGVGLPEEDWSAVERLLEGCVTPRVVKGRGVVVSLCEDEPLELDSLGRALCPMRGPVVLCTHEWE